MRAIAVFARAAAAGVAAIVLAFNLGWTAPAQAGTNLVQNGDFTGTSLSSPGGYICAGPGSTCNSNVTDWSAGCANDGCGGRGSPSSLLFYGTNGSAFNSGYGLYSVSDNIPGYTGNYVALDGDPEFVVNFFQTINGLTPGRTYDLTFYQAAGQQNGAFGSTTEYFEVSLGGETLNSPTMSNPSGGFTGFNWVSMDFTATSASETLNFFSFGAPAVPPISLIADVSLTAAVPEPATWALLLAGFAGLGLVGFRQGRMAWRAARA